MRSHRGRAYESRSLMEGRPSVACVGPDNLEHIGANVVKYYIADIGIATDDEYGCATWGHSCTPTLGFLVGHAVGSNVPPTHRFISRSMTWTRTGGVYYPRSPGHQQRTPVRPATGTSVASGIPPIHSRTPTRRPPEVRSAARGHRGGVWSRACLRTPPRHRASWWPLETRRGAGGWGFDATGCPMWGNPGGTDVPAAGRGMSGGTCGMAVHGRGSVGRRCFSTSSSLKRTYVTG